MDIPQPPPSSIKIPASTSLDVVKVSPSELGDIKLISEKIYTAKVLQKMIIAETSANIAKQKINEWLISINGKQLKISSDIAMKPEQQILVKLSSSPGISPPTLLLQSSNLGSGLGIHQQARGSNLPIIEQILKTMSQLLSKQTAISSGLQALQQNKSPVTNTHNSNTLSATYSQASNSALNKQLTTLALENLVRSLPKVEDIMVSLKTNTSDKLISGLLQQSGLFFEARQTQGPARPTLHALLEKLDLIKSQKITPPSSSQQILSMQQINLLQSILQSNANTIGGDVQPGNKTDIKETLILLLSSVSKVAQKQINISDIQTTPTPVVQNEIPSSPFNFPNLSLSSPIKNDKSVNESETNTGQLLKLLAGMLNRIQFNQLNSLYQNLNPQVEQQNIQSWFFELPLVEANGQLSTFNLRIDKEKSEQEDTTKEAEKDIQWKLVLSFDLPQLGPLYIQVNLVPPSISSIIWADRPETYALVKMETKHLESKLKSLGLEVGDIFCKQGQPQQTETKLDRNLVDIQA